MNLKSYVSSIDLVRKIIIFSAGVIYRALQGSIKIDKTQYLNFAIMKQRFLKYPLKCLQLISCNYCSCQIKLKERAAA